MGHLVKGKSPWDPGGGEVLPFTPAWVLTAESGPHSSSTDDCKMMATFRGGELSALLLVS